MAFTSEAGAVVMARRARWELAVAALSGRRAISFIVFQAPQEGQRPTHLGESCPHSEQTYTVFDLGGMRRDVLDENEWDKEVCW